MSPSGNSSTTLVVNPTAGQGKAARLLPKVMAELVKGLPEGTLRVVQAHGFAEARQACFEAVAEARRRTDERRDSLVVMGGDGMMHWGLNAAAGTGVPLGLIPAGTGNDFCRGIGIPLDPRAAARVVVQGESRVIDLASVTGRLTHDMARRWVGCVLSTGYDARVSRRGNAMPQGWGSLAYGAAALRELRGFHPLPYRLLIDGVSREGPAMMVSIANVPYFGGGMNIAPKGKATDGLLDVTIIHPVSRSTLVRLLPSMFSGKFVKDPAVEIVRAKEVLVDGEGLYGMADGEALGPVPLHIEAVPGALTVYAPADRALSRRRNLR